MLQMERQRRRRNPNCLGDNAGWQAFRTSLDQQPKNGKAMLMSKSAQSRDGFDCFHGKYDNTRIIEMSTLGEPRPRLCGAVLAACSTRRRPFRAALLQCPEDRAFAAGLSRARIDRALELAGYASEFADPFVNRRQLLPSELIDFRTRQVGRRPQREKPSLRG
jgi:hypothetical protein